MKKQYNQAPCWNSSLDGWNSSLDVYFEITTKCLINYYIFYREAAKIPDIVFNQSPYFPLRGSGIFEENVFGIMGKRFLELF